LAPSGRQVLVAASHHDEAMQSVSAVQVVAQTLAFRH